mgnify:FL=1
MRAYKGFDGKLQCRGFQYEVGKTYEENKADLCHCGFHACEFPLDVFSYYPPAGNRYCEVKLEDVSKELSDDSKRCAKKINIEAEIGIKGIIEASVKFIMNKVSWGSAKRSNTGDCSVATNTGYRSVATNTGDCSVATNTGDCSVATNIGYRSVATNTGYRSISTITGNYSISTNTGDYSASTNTGDYSASTNTGDCSVATNTGYQSISTNTGYRSVATVTGRESIAIATGQNGKAKGTIGCFIVLAEWWFDNKDCNWHIKHVKSAIVDGENIKEDTFYMLKNGEFVVTEE